MKREKNDFTEIFQILCLFLMFFVLLQERNSATLLFSALCTRIFGVKRSKLELSKRNSMSARMFFHRFPDLYDFLLNEMTNIAQVISAGSVTPEESALYPILIIIAKLQPSLIVSGENLAEKKYQVRKILFGKTRKSLESSFKF